MKFKKPKQNPIDPSDYRFSFSRKIQPDEQKKIAQAQGYKDYRHKLESIQRKLRSEFGWMPFVSSLDLHSSFPQVPESVFRSVFPDTWVGSFSSRKSIRSLCGLDPLPVGFEKFYGTGHAK